MASKFYTKRVGLLVIIFFFFIFLENSLVSSFELQVGGSDGWIVPPSNDSQFYNHWASENRFRVGDSLRFKYKKDSVMEVTEEDYKNCNSTHPTFFSNTGNTVFTLDHSGPFYFISGAAGHCEKRQRMIVKVMASEDSSHSQKSSSGSHHGAVFSLGAYYKLVLQFVVFACLSFHFV